MTATPALTTDLQKQVLLLEEDLRERVAADAGLESALEAGAPARPGQGADGGVLGGVARRPGHPGRGRLGAYHRVHPVLRGQRAGEAGLDRRPGDRRQEALDAQLAFFRAHPEDTDREWLQAAIDYLAGLPATKALVDSHSALHLVSPSGNAVTRLLDFWRTPREDGSLVHDLADTSLSTRFLGDLYQDLSQHAKDTYALLQTPVFVEEFILDRTLEPALKERPLEGFKLIDPTCGSGHFLLGAFDRLLDRWHRHAPGLEIQARVQQALDAIHGVDLNPFAVAIARFRLTVAALRASGLSSLENGPGIHLPPGRRRLPHPRPRPRRPPRHGRPHRLHVLHVRHRGRPPPADHAGGRPLRRRRRQPALHHRQRQGPQPDLPLQVLERLQGHVRTDGAVHGIVLCPRQEGEHSGWVGQITSNSFMKREFGTRLIEDFPRTPGPSPRGGHLRSPTSLVTALRPSSSSAAIKDQ